ncbi:MAG: glycoside hydrolase family 3 C-terminal domain-containing protein [Lachnospiraceae bacterium]|nr:glycoside hydrolase family 3 C-terminal domain-containing protein [Lachnospiraceae bacterium]
MRKENKVTGGTKNGSFSGILVVLLEAASLFLYVLTGRNAFTPTLSPAVLVPAALALLLQLILLAMRKRLAEKVPFMGRILQVFVYLLCFLSWAFLLASNANYLASVAVSIDGTKLTPAFLGNVALSAAAFVAAALASGRNVGTGKKPVRFLRLVAVCATILCLLIPATITALNNKAVINNALGAKTFRVEEDKGASGQSTDYYPMEFSGVDALAKSASDLCREVEQEGIVLLTNENALPLEKNAKVSLFGQGAVSINYSSTGSSSASTATYTNLRQALEEKGMEVNATLWSWYEGNGYRRADSIQEIVKTYRVNEAKWTLVEEANRESFSDYPDAAVVVLSRNSGEGFDVSTKGSDGENGSYLAITPEEEELLVNLTRLKTEGVFDKVIVLLNSALPMELDFLFRDTISVDACLWIGNVGMSGVYGVADVLCGDANPSGCLVDTFCRDVLSSPAMASWQYNPNGLFAQKYDNPNAYALNQTQQYYGVYVEGIYVGYRYYETRYEDYVLGKTGAGAYNYSQVVAFPFGHGLSYSEFETVLSGITETSDDAYEVSVTVTNQGARAGKKVSQVYLQKPYSQESYLETASVELAGFAKTGLLSPGASEQLTIRVEKQQLRVYDANDAKTYVLPQGDYYLTVAENAHEAVKQILAEKGYTSENTDGRMESPAAPNLTKKILTQAKTDTDVFSLSAQTGQRITNQLDAADINRYENRGSNQVTYLSRSNWEGTWPVASVRLSIDNEAMYEDLSCHKPISGDETESPLYAVSGGLSSAMMRGLPYDSDVWDDLLDQMTYEEQALLITNAAFGTPSISSISMPGTKASDGPTGVIGSVTAFSLPGEGVWASTYNLSLIERIGEMLAEDAKGNEVNTMYAPGINIHRTPFGGRANEYFSEDPLLTGLCAGAEVKGMQSRGVIAVLKHYAFNDEEAARNGISIWLNEQAAREIYLLPFEYAMNPSGASAYGAMSSFNRAGTLWTGADAALQIEIARKEWDFQGYFITDMAEANGALYMVYDDGVMGGTDLFLGNGSKTALASWRGSIPFRHRVREAAHRVLYVNVNFNAAMNGIASGSRLVEVTPWWEMVLYAAIGVFALLSLLLLILLNKPASFGKDCHEKNSDCGG